MRQVFDNQMQIGLPDISQIKLDANSRDEIPQVLRGLQHIYSVPQIRQRVFAVLKKLVPADVDPATGRKGMVLWRILVMGVLRLNCNWDYDHLQNMVNEHRTIRQMLGHSAFGDYTIYPLQTIKDNARLFTPDISAEISRIVAETGHQLLGVTEVKAAWDSFVVETNVHFPTDIRLLFDAVRKSIQLTARLSDTHGIAGWRQSRHHIKTIKRQMRKIQKMKHSFFKDEQKKAEHAQKIKEAHRSYICSVRVILDRIEAALAQVPDEAQKKVIANYTAHAQRQIDQIERRVLKSKAIAHSEKVLSIFEPHTEWIVKGKAGVPVELGLRVAVMKDQNQFIIHHQVMKKQTDDQVVAPMTKAAKKIFPNLNQCSYDKGGHSPANQKELAEIVDRVIMPKKGRLSAADKEREYAAEFIKVRHQHSAVESSINALENHGLDICPDHGIEGFERYVGLAVLGRNLQILGAMLQKRDRRRRKRQQAVRQSRADQALLNAA